jgi:DNA-directed RNA polymerase specialized sigma24 family protein
MADGGSVTHWLDEVKLGNERATRELWDRYFKRLVGLAAKRLPANVRRMADEEDVALSAFHSFCDRAARDQFPELSDRDGLWRLLAVITLRKVVAVVRRGSCLKRGGGLVVGESALLEGPDTDVEGLAQILAHGPSPEIAAQMAEDFTRLMEALADGPLRLIARMKMEGHSSVEIADRVGISSRSVDRKLRLIRSIWETHAPDFT